MLTQQQDKTRATEDDVKEQERIANSLEAELNSYKVQHSCIHSSVLTYSAALLYSSVH
jgi:hypothetical protein